MTAEIVHDDDVIWLEAGHENLLDIEPETLAVDWPVEHARCRDGIMAKRCKESQGLPMTMRHAGDKPFAFSAPAA